MEIIVVALVALVVVAVVLYPVLKASPAGARRVPTPLSEAELDAQVADYRAALRSGTLCLDCGRPNPADSVYCAGCGEPLVTARAAAEATTSPAT